jgi:hypothetical protein
MDVLVQGGCSAEFLTRYVDELLAADSIPKHKAMERKINKRTQEFVGYFAQESWALLGIFFMMLNSDALMLDVIAHELDDYRRSYFCTRWRPYLEQQTQQVLAPMGDPWCNLHRYSELLSQAWYTLDWSPEMLRPLPGGRPIVPLRLFSMDKTIENRLF